MLIGLNLGESQFLSHSNGCQRSPPSPGEKHKSGLPLRVLAYFTLSSHQQMDRLDVDGKNKVPPEREKNESLADIASPTSPRFRRSLIVCIKSHGQRICSSSVAATWWAVAALPLITLISALFMRPLPDRFLRGERKIFVLGVSWGRWGGVLLFSSPPRSASLRVPTASTSHSVCLLY